MYVCIEQKKVAKNRKFCVKIAIDPHFQRISNILFLCKWYSVAFWNYQMTWENEIMWIRTFTEQNGNLHNLLQLQQFSNDAKNIFSHQTHTHTKKQNWVSVAETVFFSTELVDESEKNVRFKFKKTLPKIFIHYHFMASFFSIFLCLFTGFVCIINTKQMRKMAKYFFVNLLHNFKCDIEITEKKNTEKIYINFYWTQKYDMNCFFFVPTHSNAEKSVSHWYHSAWLSNGCLQQFFFCLFFFGRFVCLFAWFAKMCHISSFNCLFFDLYCFIFWFLEELFGRFITYFSEISRLFFHTHRTLFRMT